MAQEVFGYTTLQVIPTMVGSQNALEGQLSGPLVAAGQAAGRDAGQAIATGLQQAEAAVEAASARLAQARDKEADAAGKVRVAEARLQELRDSGRATASQLARAEEALSTAQRGSLRASNTAEQAARNLEDARDRLANTTDEAVQSEGAFSSMLSNLSGRVGPAAKQMLALGAATAGVGSAMAAATEAISREASIDVLAAQLGATPTMAAEYGAIAGDLYKQGLGESFADVTTAVGAVSSSFATLGTEGEASLDKVTARALNFSKVFGTDVAEVTQTAGQLISDGLATDSTHAFDLMTTAFQRVPAMMRDELPMILREYGTFFRGLGFDTTETFSLLVDQAQKGEWALDKTADALKEFTLLGSDMSQSSQDAYKALGLDPQQMSDAVATGGQAAQDALQKVAQGLIGVEGPAERANLAVALFGTPVEDLALDQVPQFLEALAGGSDSMAGFAGSADQMGNTLNGNTANALEKLKREIQGGLVESLTSMANWVDQNRTTAATFAIALGVVGAALVTAKVAAMGYAVAQGVMAAAQGAGTAALAGNTLALGAYTIATGVIRGATLAWSGVQWLLNAALSANPLGLIVVAIAALVAGIVLAWKNSETFRAIVTAAWEGIKTAALWTWDNVLKPIFTWIIDNYKRAWDAAKTAGDGIGAAWQWISDKATAAKDWIVNAFTSVVDFVTGMPGRIRDAAAGLWDSIKDNFKSAINWLISAWNNFSLGFDFNIPVINQRVKFQIDTPDLPLLAGGGVAGRRKDGRLWGPGTPTSDSILGVDQRGVPTALVSTDEGVVKAAAMARGGAELVAALNAGWVPPLDMLRTMLPGLAGGGVVEVQDWLRGEAGKVYQYGGTGNPSWDCSGIAGGAWAKATGKTPNARYFTTDSDFAGLGWQSGPGGPGDLTIGTNGLSGSSGHMAGRAGDLNFESSGSDGVEVGSGAQGPENFPHQWHWPLGGDPGGALGSGALGSGAGAGGGLGSGGGSAGGSGSTGGGGSSSGSATRPEGVAVPVWVDNWPSNFGTSTGTQSSAAASSGTPAASSAAAATPGGDSSEPFDREAAVKTALEKAQNGFLDAGNEFKKGQLNATPFGGAVEGLQKQWANVTGLTLVVADVFEGMDVWRREQNRAAMASGSRF